MALLFLFMFASFKIYLNRSEIKLTESQNRMDQTNRMLDSLADLEKEKQRIRIAYGEKLQQEFFKKNKRVFVDISGDKNQNLTLTCLFFNQDSMKLDAIKNCILVWRKLGFQQVTFTDGYQFSNTLKLN